ncbi:TolC family protein [bacterium]|nr:TolC family protein [bacterium]
MTGKIRILGFLLLLPFLAQAEQLTLEQCREMAMAHNQRAKMAHENQQAAKQLRKAAFTSFLPRVDLLGTYLRFNKKIKVETPDLQLPILDMSTGGAAQSLYLPAQTLTLGEHKFFLLNAGLTQLVFSGGKAWELYSISKSYENLTAAQADQAMAEALYHTTDIYWKLVSVGEKKVLAEKYKAVVSKHVTDLQNYYEEGLVTRNEILMASVKLSEAELNVLKANNGIQLAKMALCQAIGLDLDADIEPVAVFATPQGNEAVEQVLADALKHRGEIRMLENGVDIAKSVVKLNRSSHFPNILFTANYFTINPNPYDSFRDSFGSDYFYGFAAEWDLFHWNEGGFRTSAAKHQEEVVKLQLDEAKELVTLEVNQTVFKLREAAVKIEMTSTALQQAEENLRITNDNFSEGMVSSTIVLEAQTLWQKAYSENSDARAEYRLMHAELEKVAGAFSDKGENDNE